MGAMPRPLGPTRPMACFWTAGSIRSRTACARRCAALAIQGTTICPSVVLISMFSGVEVQPQARLGVRLPLKNGRSA